MNIWSVQPITAYWLLVKNHGLKHREDHNDHSISNKQTKDIPTRNQDMQKPTDAKL